MILKERLANLREEKFLPKVLSKTNYQTTVEPPKHWTPATP